MRNEQDKSPQITVWAAPASPARQSILHPLQADHADYKGRELRGLQKRIRSGICGLTCTCSPMLASGSENGFLGPNSQRFQSILYSSRTLRPPKLALSLAQFSCFQESSTSLGPSFGLAQFLRSVRGSSCAVNAHNI